MLTVALLCLSAAVFMWVLQYKMSLYHVEHSAPAPAAKLWMGRTSDTVQLTEGQHLEQSPVLTSALFLIFYLSVLISSCANSAARVSWIQQHLYTVWKLKIRSLLNPFYFRPPPVRSQFLFLN